MKIFKMLFSDHTTAHLNFIPKVVYKILQFATLVVVGGRPNITHPNIPKFMHLCLTAKGIYFSSQGECNEKYASLYVHLRLFVGKFCMLVCILQHAVAYSIWTTLFVAFSFPAKFANNLRYTISTPLASFFDVLPYRY